MKKMLAVFFIMFSSLSVSSLAFADLVDDGKKVETVGVDVTPKIIAGFLLLAVSGSIAFTILGGKFAGLGVRLGASLLIIVIAYLLVVNTSIGEALTDLLNISNPKQMFKN